MELPHVAASRIVRQVSGLAHLSPGEWLCYVVQIFIQTTQNATQFPLIPGWSRGRGRQEGGTHARLKIMLKMLITVDSSVTNCNGATRYG